MITSTHTYVVMDVDPRTYAVIKQKLLDAGYDHAINDGRLNMQGIALRDEEMNDSHSRTG